MYCYTQINENNIVINILKIDEPATINLDCLRLLSDESSVQLGDIYDPKTDTFTRPHTTPIPSPELTGEQVIMLAIADIMEEMQEIKEALAHG